MSIKEKIEKVAETFKRLGESLNPPAVAPVRVGNYINRRNYRRLVR